MNDYKLHLVQNSSPPPMDSYDEEAQRQKVGNTTTYGTTSGEEMTDGMDRMDMEDWLLKQHATQRHAFTAFAKNERSLDDTDVEDCLLACIGKESISEQLLIDEQQFVSRDSSTSELIEPGTSKLVPSNHQFSEAFLTEEEEEAITSISGLYYDQASVTKEVGVELPAVSSRHSDKIDPTILERRTVPESRPGAYSVPGWLVSRVRRLSSFVSQSELDTSAIDQIMSSSPETDDHSTQPLDHVFEAELSRPKVEHMVIEGVRVMGPKQQRICIMLGWLGLASILAVLVAMITKWLTSSSSHVAADTTNMTGSPYLPMVPESPETFETLAPKSSLFEENMNWTVADAILYAANGGPSITIVPASYLFLSVVNQTDTNFTFFGIKLGESVLDGVNPSIISKMASVLWSGHAVRRSSCV